MVENIKFKYDDDFLKSRNGNTWVFLRYKNGRENEILFFETSREVRKYLNSNKNMYNWLIPNYPEDIAFFKDGCCWFYSVTHEGYCEIFCDTKKEYEHMKSLGINFEDKCVPFPKEKLYYENYLK